MTRSTRSYGFLEVAFVGALAIGGLAVVGQLNPLRGPVVVTDRLGPDNGEMVSEYLDRAASTLRTEDEEPRWASVSFDSPLTPAQAYAAASGVRVSVVLLRVPLDRVQTPVLTVGVSGSETSVLNSGRRAASGLPDSAGTQDRQALIDDVSRGRLVDGCACVVTLVVRGTPAELTNVLAHEQVRAVEALPADAVAGKFAVTALLPDYVDVVAPLPDDGVVPPG